MELGGFFFELAATYNRLDGLHSPAQALLRNAPQLLADYAPAGITIISGGGKGMATYTPWVGFFNPDETDSPQKGLYVVYLLSEDLESLTLSLNQGMEYLRSRLGDTGARQQLAAEAAAIRRHLAPGALTGTAAQMNLNSKGARQKAYQAGNITSKTYEPGSLPSEAELAADLSRFLRLYDDAIEARDNLLVSAPGSIESPGATRTRETDELVGFKPKNADDYRSVVVGRELIKSRRHERIVADFASYAASNGFVPTTEHPIDLVIRKSGRTYIVEIKVLYRQNATAAVRAALGQLSTYSYFLYPEGEQPDLVALFSEPVGDAYTRFLAHHQITSVWWESGSWHGSSQAEAHGLVTSRLT